MTGSSIDLTITSGPSLQPFLDATLKSGVGLVEFKTTAPRLKGRGVTPTTSIVEITAARCEDGSGMLFIFEGTLRGRAVNGFYNAKADSSGHRTGHITFAS